MENVAIKHDELKNYTENRNKILSVLHHVYMNDSYDTSCNLDNKFDAAHTREELHSPMACDESKSVSCYRCTHFSNVPPNILQTTYESISDSTQKYETDLTFVQAIVWLKSAIASMKDVSVEQFHLIFHKMWNDNRIKSHNQNSDVEVQGLSRKRLQLTRKISDKQSAQESSRANFDTNSESVDSNKTKAGIGERSISYTISPSSPQRYCSNFTKNNDVLKNYIIPESDEEYSPTPDMFDDSLKSQEASNTLQLENDIECLEETDIDDETTPELSVILQSDLFSICSNERSGCSSPENDLKTNASFIVKSSDDYSTLDNSAFLNEASRYKKDYILRNEKKDPCSLDLNDENVSLSNQEFTPTEDLNFQIADISDFLPSSNDIANISPFETIDIISLQNEDSAYETKNVEVSTQDTSKTKVHGMRDNNQKSFIRSDSLETRKTIGRDFVSPEKNTCEKRDKNVFENNEKYKRQICGGKRKLEPEVNRLPKEEKKLSCRWLNFNLDASNADNVALQSVKVILWFLQDERIAKQYMKRRCWANTLEKEAIAAILNFCDIFEAEKKTNTCSQEIVRTITRTLGKIIGNVELNKATLWTYQISIVLELCNSVQVCTETTDYLFTKLKSYESIITSTINGNQSALHNVVNQLHLILYALSVCLYKYRLVYPSKRENQSEKCIIPSVVDLWKKQLNPQGVMKEESAQMKEQRWLKLLDDFTVIATEHFVQFAEKARELFCVLTN